MSRYTIGKGIVGEVLPTYIGYGDDAYIRVTHYLNVEPQGYWASNDIDARGYWEADFVVCDVNGNELPADLSEKDIERIRDEIHEAASEEWVP